MREDNTSYHVSSEELETRTIPAVQIVLMRESERGTEVFLGRRIAGSFQQQWAFPGGSVEKGETPEKAACREAGEETGVVIQENDINLFRKTTSTTTREKDGKKFQYIYTISVFTIPADTLTPSNASVQEHAEMRWMSLHDELQLHTQAVHDAEVRGLSPTPDTIPGALSPKTLETITLLSQREIHK